MLIVYRQHVNVFLFLQQADRISAAWPAYGSSSHVNRNGCSGLQILTSKCRPVPKKLKIGLHDPAILYLGRCPKGSKSWFKHICSYMSIFIIAESVTASQMVDAACTSFNRQYNICIKWNSAFSREIQMHTTAWENLKTLHPVKQASRQGQVNARCLE